MDTKKTLSTVAAASLAAGVGSFKAGESNGRDAALAPLKTTPLAGQKIILSAFPNQPSIFALTSPDIPKDHLARLIDACPTNQWIVVAGAGRVK